MYSPGLAVSIKCVWWLWPTPSWRSCLSRLPDNPNMGRDSVGGADWGWMKLGCPLTGPAPVTQKAFALNYEQYATQPASSCRKNSKYLLSRLKARGLLHWNWTSQKLHKVTQRCFFGDLSSSLYLLLINSIQNHRSLCYIIFHLLITT